MVRLIDTGIRGARENVTLDRALVDAHVARATPDTLRFLRFRPSALVGLHQILEHEVRLDYCRAQGIEVGRRITGGGGLYLDEGQLGWELVLDRARFPGLDLASIAAAICEAVAHGLRSLGVDARFRPRNDLEVDGRKLGGTGGFVDGGTVFFQGTLLADFDPSRMIEVLKVPVEKLARRDLEDARRRVVTLRELLGAAPDTAALKAALATGFRERLGLSFEDGALTAYEEALAARCLAEEIGTDAFVAGAAMSGAGGELRSTTLFTRGGSIRADLRIESSGAPRIREALVTGDFLVDPPRAVLDLEAALRGATLDEAPGVAQAFLSRPGIVLLGLEAADFRAAIERALAQLSLRADGRELRAHRLGARGGERPTLVFLHDALGSVRLWRDLPERLAAALDTEALSYDRWGSGDSEPLARPHSPAYLLGEALRALPQVLERCGIEDAVLIGQSDGASIALAAAGALCSRVRGAPSPRIRGVVALSPHLFCEARTRAAIDAQIRDFATGDLRARLRRHHGERTDLLFERLVQVWTAPRAGWGLEPYVAKVECPVLAIQGEDDEFFSAAQVDALARLVPALERLRLAGCGHYPHLQARRDTFAAIRDFVRRRCL